MDVVMTEAAPNGTHDMLLARSAAVLVISYRQLLEHARRLESEISSLVLRCCDR